MRQRKKLVVIALERFPGNEVRLVCEDGAILRVSLDPDWTGGSLHQGPMSDDSERKARLAVSEIPPGKSLCW
jgi:hypothetical protein